MPTDSAYAIEITARTQQFETALKNAAASAEAAFQRIDSAASKSLVGGRLAPQASSQLDGLTAKIVSFGRTAAASLGVPLGAAAFLLFLKDAHDKAADEERSFAQLNSTLRATQSAAGLTAKSLADLSAEVQGKSIFDDDAIRKAEIALLRFRTVQGDVFKDAIRLVPDVATALGTDLPTAAQALGRALTDPETGLRALKAAGLALSDQQKDLAARLTETGDKAGAQKIVLDELAKSIGGVAESDTAGVYGATKRLSRAWDDLVKTLGRQALSGSSDFTSSLATKLERLNQQAEKTKLTFSDLVGLLTKPGAFASAALNVLMGHGVEVDVGAKERAAATFTPTTGLSAADIAAADGAREARLSERANQAYNDQQTALKHAGELAAGAYASQLAQTKFFIDRQSALYAEGYAHNAVSTADFYQQQRDAAEQTTQAVLAGLTKQALAAEALANAPSTSRDERQAQIVKVQGLAAQSDQARFALKQQLLGIDIQQSGAVIKLNDDYEALRATLLGLRGDEVAAAHLEFQNAHRDQLARLNAEVNSQKGTDASRASAQQARDDLLAMGQLIDVRARLSEATKNYGLSLDSLGIEVERINIAESSGALSSIDALQKRSDANAKYAEILRKQLVSLEALAAASGRPEDIVRVEQLRVQMEALAAQTDLVAKRFNDIATSSFADFVTDVVTGTKSISQAFRDMEKAVVQAITRIIAQNLAEKLFGKGGAGSGFGDLLSKLFGSSGAGSSGGSSVGGGIDLGQFGGSGIGQLASGTDNWRGGWTWVGEHGKELLRLPRGSRVLPSNRAREFGYGGEIHINQTVNVLPGADASSARQAAARLRDATMGAIRDR